MNHQAECALAEVIQTRPMGREILNVCCEVTWPDGSTVGLYPVRVDGVLPTFLRAIHHAGKWTLFDLRHVIPRHVEEIAQAQTRDQVGLVMYALRSATVNAAAFLARVDRHVMDRWPGPSRPSVPRPTAAAAPQRTASGIPFHAIAVPQEA